MASNILYIAFQESVVPSDTNKSWNNSANRITPGITNMVDEDGNATTIDLVQNVNGDGDSPNGGDAVGINDAAWVDEIGISNEGHYVNATTAQYDFEGLTDSSTYEFEVFGSSSDGRETEWSFDGFSTTEGVLDNYDSGNTERNRRYTVVMSGISPTAGKIEMQWRKVSGTSYGFMNAMKITETPGTTNTTIAVPTGPLR